MTKRAILPGADELFRKTTRQPEDDVRAAQSLESPSISGSKGTNLQVAEITKPRHEEKVTFYCTGGELTRLERARLALRAEHKISADRGRLVRAALDEVLEDFESRGLNSALVKRLEGS